MKNLKNGPHKKILIKPQQRVLDACLTLLRAPPTSQSLPAVQGWVSRTFKAVGVGLQTCWHPG